MASQFLRVVQLRNMIISLEQIHGPLMRTRLLATLPISCLGLIRNNKGVASTTSSFSTFLPLPFHHSPPPSLPPLFLSLYSILPIPIPIPMPMPIPFLTCISIWWGSSMNRSINILSSPKRTHIKSENMLII